jgi:serine phosphatase RsbU (regulator of sigma subunit)
MILGILDISTNTLQYSVAGHLPLPILASGDKAEFLEATGMPLGIVKDVEYHDYKVELPEDFDLLLFSDGVLEILPVDGLLKKEDFLLDLVAGGCRDIDGLKEKLSLETINDAPDDIAVVCVHKGSNVQGG